MDEGRCFLVQWQTDGAEFWVGKTPTESVGAHMKGLIKGDRIFVSACDDKELYLLGAMKVSSLSITGSGPDHGKPLAVGETLAGPFQILPLGGLKWRLRFENTQSPKLSPSKSLLWQVKSRRRLTRASSEILLDKLLEEQAHPSRKKR